MEISKKEYEKLQKKLKALKKKNKNLRNDNEKLMIMMSYIYSCQDIACIGIGEDKRGKYVSLLLGNERFGFGENKKYLSSNTPDGIRVDLLSMILHQIYQDAEMVQNIHNTIDDFLKMYDERIGFDEEDCCCGCCDCCDDDEPDGELDDQCRQSERIKVIENGKFTIEYNEDTDSLDSFFPVPDDCDLFIPVKLDSHTPEGVRSAYYKAILSYLFPAETIPLMEDEADSIFEDLGTIDIAEGEDADDSDGEAADSEDSKIIP